MASRPQRRRGDTHLSLFSKEGLGILKRCTVSSSVDSSTVAESVAVSCSEAYEETLRGPVPVSVPGSDEVRCGTCDVAFDSRRDQVQHYRLDWHRYNLKRRLSGQRCVGEDEFEALSANISSLSGSDSSDEDSRDPKDSVSGDISSISPSTRKKDTVRTHNNSKLLQLKTVNCHIYGIYPHTVYNPKNCPDTSSELRVLLDRLASSGSNTVWVILMKSGGHFAGGVFRGSSCVAHKTFHRYTVRAKRGTSQSTKDSKSGGHQPKSAGASLRRSNEAALEQDIAKLLGDWSRFFSEASAIFVRLPAHGRSSFFSGPLEKDDPRMRGIPLITRRPTLSEVARVHQVLSTIFDFGMIIESQQEVHPSNHVGTTALLSTDNKTMDSILPGQPNSLSNADNTNESSKHSYPNTSVVVNPISARSPSNKDVGKKKGTAHLKNKDVRMSSTTTSTDPSSSADQQHLSQQVRYPDSVVGELLKVIQLPCQVDGLQGEGNEDVRLRQVRELLEKHCSLHQIQDVTTTGTEDTTEAASEQFSQSQVVNVSETSPNILQCSTDNTVTDNAGSETLGENTSQQDVASVQLEDKGESSVKYREDSKCDTTAIGSPLNEQFSLHQDKGDFTTLLHTSSRLGQSEVVWLLLGHGAGPERKDGSGKTPYSLAADKPTRDAFRKFMAVHPAAHDYSASQIPSALTAEMEAIRKEKLAEKNRAKKKLKKIKEKATKAMKEEQRVEEEKKVAEKNLSEREKRALAAERRILKSTPAMAASMLASAGSCARCRSSLAGMVPFARLDHKYCSMECVKSHKAALQDRA